MLNTFQTGFLSSLPYLGRFSMAVAGSVVCDRLMAGGSSVAFVRTFSMALASIPTAIGLGAVGLMAGNPAACMISMFVGRMIYENIIYDSYPG